MVPSYKADRQLKEVIQVRSIKPTINDVARVAGVSRTTASRVLNDKPGVSWPLRQRVHQAVAELGYQPNENARALASGRQRVVGLTTVTFSPDPAFGGHPYCARILAGVITALRNREEIS